MSNTEKVAVKKATLDSYIERIQLCVKNNDNGMFIKIDTEGAEFSIMLGSQKVFNLERPIFMQFEYGHGWKQVLN